MTQWMVLIFDVTNYFYCSFLMKENYLLSDEDELMKGEMYHYGLRIGVAAANNPV